MWYSSEKKALNRKGSNTMHDSTLITNMHSICMPTTIKIFHAEVFLLEVFYFTIHLKKRYDNYTHEHTFYKKNQLPISSKITNSCI